METVQDEGEGSLAVPQRPTDYRRMLSWQLSHVQAAPAANARRAQKERERRRKRRGNSSSSVEAGQEGSSECGDDREREEEDTEGSGGGGSEGKFAYLVVNSEGEEECYYSAPESPLDSEGTILIYF